MFEPLWRRRRPNQHSRTRGSHAFPVLRSSPMRLPAIAAATTTILLVGAGHAHAQTPEHRFYVSVHAGQDRQDDEKIRGANAAGLPRNNDLTFSDGRVYAAALGVN